MKTIIKSLALALSLGFVASTATFADTNPGARPAAVASYQSSVYSSIDGKLNIALDKQTGGAIDICLKGTNGKILYSQHVGKKETQYRTRLNLADLPDGTYQVAITNGAETTTHTITLATQQPAAPSRLITMK